MVPHNTWAKYYDFVYEQTFGPAYQSFTNLTLSAIAGILYKGSIIDYGSGTGRLTFPLLKRGYDVTGVEQSEGMVNEFYNKAYHIGYKTYVYQGSIANFKGSQAELALTLFTVLSYTLTKEEMLKNFQNISDHLLSQGYLFFDFPDPVFFEKEQMISINRADFKRSVKLIPVGNDNIFRYQEECSGIMDGEPFHYQEEFDIKQWSLNEIDEMLQNVGLKDTKTAFPQFANTGSTYKLYQKQ